MAVRIRVAGFLLLFPLVYLVPSARAQWQEPTPDELKMTLDPAAPGAAAVYLYREETVDDTLRIHTLYARIKILRDSGKDLGDVEIGTYRGHNESITNVSGRTIHPDGTIVPFVGKPFGKTVLKGRGFKYLAKIFTLPDVQVGSILEYRYTLRYPDDVAEPPAWLLQQPYFVHKAHYHFVPSENLSTGFAGKNRVAYAHILPAGVEVKHNEQRNTFDLDVENIPALAAENDMPPIASLTYRVLFYYTDVRTPEEYWRKAGAKWSKWVDEFAQPTDTLRSAVAQLLMPADSDEQKLEKIYIAVMGVENTTLERTHTEQEDKAQGIRIRNAEDVWKQKRGGDDEIALLFLAMLRAAGMKGYAMVVTDRGRAIFQNAFLSMNQFNDYIVVVPVGGVEEYFDPGQRYCEFKHLRWQHSQTYGMRQLPDGGTAIAMTPQPSYKNTRIVRTANLTVSQSGSVSGEIEISMTGDAAVGIRHDLLLSDAEQVGKEMVDTFEHKLPNGLHLTFDHFASQDNSKMAFVAAFRVSGELRSASSRRMFLPASLFEAQARPRFAVEKRETPVDLQYPYGVEDHVSITLPPGVTVESLPEPARLSMAHSAMFGSGYRVQDGKLYMSRALAVGSYLYSVQEYPDLRDFLQKVSSKDQEQVVLKMTP